jgi:glycerol-3-phosphate dehydrogenase (NAD(P)+)
MTKIVTVLGDGAWGTAFATLLAAHNYHVILWCFNNSVADSIQKTRINSTFLPGITLSPLIEPTLSLEYALSNTQWIFEAIPVRFIRSTFEQAQPFFKAKQRIVILSKGLESSSLLLPTQIINQVVTNKHELFVLSGPSFATELALKQPTAVNLATTYPQETQELQELLHTNYFMTHVTSDVIGVQAAGAFKNIIALAVGMLAGMGYSANTKAIALTQGLQEIAALIAVLGGKAETAYTLAGLGDLVLTACSQESKNYKLGYAFGQHKKLKELEEQFPVLPEGVNTLTSVQQLISKHQLNLPLCNVIYKIIFANTPATNLLGALGFAGRLA